ncbi:hypothetical protein FS935_22395 [Metabacillus litoralis]|uniref:SEC-C domain-containing protein n=1 Tax=Metabacillus litoralis TaxID=152268 RepID=A0A5C6V191_9BACI|nr:hypothetical protein [Metabacillus litoralis]TXC78734.1 hypothetical protein FS935_22395 [Metabacillus litoralis]
MKKLFLCYCGSGVALDECCSNRDDNFMFKSFNTSDEHKHLLRNLTMSSEFGLPYRGLIQFYANDLVSYKLANPRSKSQNEFLEIISLYFTIFLQNDCPSSWLNCNSEFWEEFIFSFYPLHIKVTSKEKEVKKFAVELKKFTHWLDCRYGSSFYQLINTFLTESVIELKICEKILNKLYLHTFPEIHQEDWDFTKEFFLNSLSLDKCKEKETIIFEVKAINGPIVTITTLTTYKTYYIKNMPYEIIVPGTLLSGKIGKKEGDWFWIWNQPESVFPPRGRDYIKNIRFS